MNAQAAQVLQSPPATDADLDEWVREGRNDQTTPFVLYHAHNIFRRGGALKDNPFDDQAPRARERWTWFFKQSQAAEKTRRRELAQMAVGGSQEGFDL